MRKRVLPQGGKLVRVAGIPVWFEAERNIDQNKIDHVWLHVKAGDQGTIRISLSTWSRKSFESGYDPCIRVAIVTSRWRTLPALGIFPSNGLDYADIPTTNSDVFFEYERLALEQLIAANFERAAVVEAWGEVYLRGHRGIHQVHSRRASSVIATDHVGRDGAVRFYYEEGRTTELLLFKFFGQP
jgi:hypothetical protein